MCGMVTALGTIIYLSLAGGRYIWTDEAYTLVLIQHSYAEICSITAADVHPPLYYILLKFCIQPFGYSQTAAKLFSIIPFILILAIGGIQLPRIFDQKTAFIFMLLFLFFPFSLSFATEIRMYSLAALFVFVTGIYGYLYYEKNRKSDYWIWILSGVCASYTHYFAMVSVSIIYFLLFTAICLRKKPLLKHWFTAVFISFMLYLPWLSCFVQQLVYKVNHDYWIPAITRRTIMEYAVTMFSSAGLEKFEVYALCSYLIVFIFVLSSGFKPGSKKAVRRLSGLFALHGSAHKKRAALLSLCALSVPAGTVLIGIAASLLIRPVFVIRYCMPAVPLLIVFMASGLCQIRFRILTIILCGITFIGGISHYRVTLQTENRSIENALDNTFTEAHSHCDAYVVLTTPPEVSSVLAYYAPDKPIYGNRAVTAADPYDNLAYIDQLDTSANQTLILLLNTGSKIPDYLLNLYQVRFLQNVIDSGTVLDAYLMISE